MFYISGDSDWHTRIKIMKTTTIPDPNPKTQNLHYYLKTSKIPTVTPIDEAPQIFQNMHHCFRDFFCGNMICFQELSASNLTMIKERDVCEIYIKTTVPNNPRLLGGGSLSNELNCLKGFGGGYFYH